MPTMEELEGVLAALGLQDLPLADATIEWPCSLRTTVSNERALTLALKPFSKPQHMHRLAWALPESVRDEIGQIGAALGFTAKQTFSFRRGLLKCTMGMKPFMALSGNDDAKARLIAEAFEAEIERFVRARLPPDALSAVTITTEAQRKAAAEAEDRPYGPTPDLTFEPPIRINGRTVAWIDAKMLYASCVLQNERFMPENRLPDTAAKYNAAFGRGAFVFGGGFCEGLEADVRATLLDATPLSMERIAAVIESDQSEAAMSLEEMRIALGLASPTPLPGVPIAVEASSTTRPHQWDARVRCSSAGVVTFHYHICTVCGAKGVRRKVSRKKTAIYTGVVQCGA